MSSLYQTLPPEWRDGVPKVADRIDGYEVYKLFIALKTHFSSPTYDFFQHRAKTRASQTSFERRNDRWFFHKIAKKVKGSEVRDFLLSNIIVNPSIWIGEIADNLDSTSKDNFARWQGRIEGINYRFKQDCHDLRTWMDINERTFNDLFTPERSGEHPFIFRQYRSGKITLETITILNSIFGFIQRLDMKYDDVIWRNKTGLILKYEPFIRDRFGVRYSQFKKTCKEIFVDG